MNGVEILAVEQVATVFTFNWIACLITASIIALVCLVIGLNTGDKRALAGVIATGIVCSLTFGALAGIGLGEAIEYTNQYKVTVSDDVSMNEFIEKYEIIEQDGKIYTVREK